MKRLVIELMTSQTTKNKPHFGAVFNMIVSRKLIEDYQNITDIEVILKENMKTDDDFQIFLSSSKVKVNIVRHTSDITGILSNEPNTLYFSPMNLHGFEFLPGSVKSISVVHDIRDFVIYSTASQNLENEKLYYSVNKYNSINDLTAYLLSHSSPRLYGRVMQHRGNKWIGKFLGRLEKADGIIFNSLATQERVRSIGSTELKGKEIEVIYPPVNRTKTFNSGVPCENVPENFFLMLSASRKEKNLYTVLGGFWEYCSMGDDNPFSLVLTGTTPQLARYIKRNFDYSDRIICIPYTSQEMVDQLISNSVALLMPSIDEGFGHPVMEAMNAGIPVVCSDIPIFREIGDGYSIFFKHKDSRMLSEILLTLSESKFGRDHYSNTNVKHGMWYKNESDARLEKISKFVLGLLRE